MMPLYEAIGPDVEIALGAVVSAECRRLAVSPRCVAARGKFTLSLVQALRRGRHQPNLAAFIVLAWSLHEDPRELFDKLLTQMQLHPGWRPALDVE